MIIPTGFAQVNLVFDGSGYTRGAQVVFGVDNNAAVDAADLAALVIASAVTDIMGVMGTAIALKEVKVKLGPNATGGEATVAAGDEGTATGNTLPPQSAVLSKKITALGGQLHSGRAFWPGATENQTDGAGQLTDTALGEWQDALDAFYDHLVADDIPPVLLHSDATTPDAILAFSVSRLMATQKRRIRRVGSRSAA